MTPARFDALFQETIEKVKGLLRVKGGEYAPDAERLANFKTNAAALGQPPLLVWAIYAGKHWDSIRTYISDLAKGKERERAEPMEGRFLDHITYGFLGLALQEEQARPMQILRDDGRPDAEQVKIKHYQPTAPKELKLIDNPGLWGLLQKTPDGWRRMAAQKLAEALSCDAKDQRALEFKLEQNPIAMKGLVALREKLNRLGNLEVLLENEVLPALERYGEVALCTDLQDVMGVPRAPSFGSHAPDTDAEARGDR